MIEGYKMQTLDGVFSKGLIQDKGRYTMPISYSPDILNMRITNGNSIIRKGFITRVYGGVVATYGYNQGIGSDGTSLYAVVNGNFCVVDLSTGTYTVKGAVSGAVNDHNIFFYGQYVIVCTGSTIPYVYDTVAGTINTAPPISATAKPAFGVSFANLTIVGGTGSSGGANGNIAYISRGITLSNQNYSYDRSGIGAEQIPFRSNLLGMVSTLNQVYFFCNHGIETMTRDSITTLGGVAVTYTVPVVGYNQPSSHRSIVVSDDAIFYFTKNKTVQSIGFIAGVTSAKVAQVSERPEQSIKDYLDSLDDDQSKSCGVFNRRDRTIERHLKKKGSPINNTTLVYDIVNDTFLLDQGKYYSQVIEHNNKIYASSCLNTTIFEDSIGQDDDGAGISWRRITKPLSFGNQNIRKKYGELGIVGQMNQIGKYRVDIFMDGFSEAYAEFTGDLQDSGGLGSVALGSLPIGGESGSNDIKDFEHVIGKGRFKAKGKKVQILISGNTVGTEIVLSSMYIGVKPLGNTELSDKA